VGGKGIWGNDNEKGLYQNEERERAFNYGVIYNRVHRIIKGNIKGNNKEKGIYYKGHGGSEPIYEERYNKSHIITKEIYCKGKGMREIETIIGASITTGSLDNINSMDGRKGTNKGRDIGMICIQEPQREEGGSNNIYIYILYLYIYIYILTDTTHRGNQT
jgi:hypothetical protein